MLKMLTIYSFTHNTGNKYLLSYYLGLHTYRTQIATHVKQGKSLNSGLKQHGSYPERPSNHEESMTAYNAT